MARPNFLHVIVDDLRTTPGHTPHLDELASSGLTLLRAFSQVPQCTPSRASFFTGRTPRFTNSLPHSEGGRPATQDPSGAALRTLPQYLKRSGYRCVGAGKLLPYVDYLGSLKICEAWCRNPEAVSTWAERCGWSGACAGCAECAVPDAPTWDEYFEIDRPQRATCAPTAGAPSAPSSSSWPTAGAYERCTRYAGGSCSAAVPSVWCAQGDARDGDRAAVGTFHEDLEYTQRAVEWLDDIGRASSPPPFYVAVGLRKPHTPFIAPSKFYAQADALLLGANATARAARAAWPISAAPDFPVDGSLTKLSYSSCLAIGGGGYSTLRVGGRGALSLREPLPTPAQRALRRAYAACARFADDNIGQLLNALRANRLDDSTVVLVHSDHGFSLGERNAWCKKTSRADANRVPLILRAPGMAAAGRRSHALVGV